MQFGKNESVKLKNGRRILRKGGNKIFRNHMGMFAFSAGTTISLVEHFVSIDLHEKAA